MSGDQGLKVKPQGQASFGRPAMADLNCRTAQACSACPVVTGAAADRRSRARRAHAREVLRAEQRGRVLAGSPQLRCPWAEQPRDYSRNSWQESAIRPFMVPEDIVAAAAAAAAHAATSLGADANAVSRAVAAAVLNAKYATPKYSSQSATTTTMQPPGLCSSSGCEWFDGSSTEVPRSQSSTPRASTSLCADSSSPEQSDMSVPPPSMMEGPHVSTHQASKGSTRDFAACSVTPESEVFFTQAAEEQAVVLHAPLEAVVASSVDALMHLQRDGEGLDVKVPSGALRTEMSETQSRDTSSAAPEASAIGCKVKLCGLTGPFAKKNGLRCRVTAWNANAHKFEVTSLDGRRALIPGQFLEVM